MKFLVDNQLPAALARYLVSQGIECRHVHEIGLAQASDTEIWEYAFRKDYVLISKDADFLYRAQSAASNGKLVWIRIGNCRTRDLLAAFETLWSKVEASFAARDRVVELR